MARAATATARIATRSTWLDAHGAAEDVANGAVRALPHLLELELLDARLVRRDGRALDTHTVLLDGLGRLDGNLVARPPISGSVRQRSAFSHRFVLAAHR